MISHIVCVTINTVILLLLLVAGISLAAGSSADEATEYIKAALFQAPAILALAGFTIALYALLPRRAGALAWAAIMVSLIAGPFFGTLLDIPEAIRDISPFNHIPAMPADVAAAPVITLLGVALILTLIGKKLFHNNTIYPGAAAAAGQLYPSSLNKRMSSSGAVGYVGNAVFALSKQFVESVSKPGAKSPMKKRS